MNIFFDLDGTLIDSRIRVYNLFSFLTNNTRISIDEYWSLKRSMYQNEWILDNLFKYTPRQIEEFKTNWMSLIESREYLMYDRVFDFTISTLELLKKNNLYLITSRQSEQSALEQIKSLQLDTYFKSILVTRQEFEKDELITISNIGVDCDDLFVGDTGLDIKAGKKLGIKTIAVLSGFRNYESLEKYNPDIILKDVSELIIRCQ
jgi:phosphoglycolate phosphatase